MNLAVDTLVIQIEMLKHLHPGGVEGVRNLMLLPEDSRDAYCYVPWMTNFLKGFKSLEKLWIVVAEMEAYIGEIKPRPLAFDFEDDFRDDINDMVK